MRVEITLLGNVPSKKNSRRTFFRKGRIINIPSEKYVEWHKEASKQIEAQGVKSVKGRVELVVRFWYKDNRRKDNDNSYQSVTDLLQDCGVIEDDSWQIIPKCTIEAMGVDNKNPRAEIVIKSLDG